MIKPGLIPTGKIRRGCVAGIAISLLVLFILLARLTFFSAQAYHQGKAAYAAGEYPQAVEAFTLSIRHYYPGNRYSGAAVESAIEAIDQLLTNGEREQALLGLYEVRAALQSARSVYQPYSLPLQTVEERLKRLNDEAKH